MRTTTAIKRLFLLATLAFFAIGTTSATERPVEITAEVTRYENGTAFANGKVTFRDGTVILRCDRLEYTAAAKQARCFGLTQAEISGITIALGNSTYDAQAKQITATPTQK